MALLLSVAAPGLGRLANADPVGLLAEETITRSPATTTYHFTLDAQPDDGEQVRLSLDARIDWPNYGGSNPWIIVTINGKPLEAPHLLNKPVDFTMLNGMDATWVSDVRWRICYAPDFSNHIRTGQFALAIPDTEAFGFVWDITQFVRPGQNTVQIQHLRVLTEGSTLVLAHVRLDVGPALAAPQPDEADWDPEDQQAEWIVGQPRPGVPLQAAVADGGAIQLKVLDHQWIVRTRTSASNGRWIETGEQSWRALRADQPVETTWQGEGYRVRRVVMHRGDHLHVKDTITNLTDQRIGVMYENRLPVDREPDERLLAGRLVFDARQQSSAATHPSVMLRWGELTLGMIAEDDIFRVHHVAFSEPDEVGLADRQLGVGPGNAHTLEWDLYAVPGDYWTFINAVREDWGSNYTIPRPVLVNFDADGSLPAEAYGDWTRRRGVTRQISGQTAFKDGMLAEGTAIPLAREWCDGFRQWGQKLRGVEPEAEALIYLHTQICTEPDMQARYGDSRYLDEHGRQRTSPYHYPVYKFLPTLDNSYGRALQETVRALIEDLQADGVFIDEMAGSHEPAYDAAWDGCTAVIHPQTHALEGVRSSPALLQLPWLLWLVDYMEDHQKTVIGNNPPVTRSLLRKQIPCFIETNSNASIIDAHLASPWGLGNNTSDRKSRAAKVRGLLRHGGVFTPYGWSDPVEEDALQFVTVMYPITPVSLAPGVVLAEERILTMRSGTFGWMAGKPGEVYVFDADGMPVREPHLQRLVDEGRHLVNLRLQRGQFAVIVKAESSAIQP